ncbi:MAG TPA: PRC-barrel domain-containing protein [Pirellulales bacterium]|nr:PRC-barrel domain-containing protein [Pirellulales bacterium]
MAPNFVKALASNVKNGSLNANAEMANRRAVAFRGAHAVAAILLALGAWSSLSCSLVAQAIKPEERRTGPRPANEQVRSTEGPIFRASALEKAGVETKDGKDAGKIQDLILDLDTGRVALLVLDGQVADGGSASVVVPMSALGDINGNKESLRLSSEQVQTAPHPPKDKGDITREWTAVALQHFGVTPYWNSEKLDVGSKDVLMPVSRLRGGVVTGKDGKEIGRIADFAVTMRGDIAYAGVAMEGNDQRLHPIPLSAFVVPAGNAAWQLSLARDIVANTPTFAAADWPKTLDRGWLEYVHVRYGRSVFDGVNRTAHPNQARAEKSEVR